MMRRALIIGLAYLCCGTNLRAQRVIWEQDFDTPAALNSWQINGDIDEVRIESAALICRGIGGDPLMVYRPEFKIDANAFQAVEVCMKADHDGLAQLFWSGTTEGRYGGFSGDKRTEFGVTGDGVFHTYRVFPFWQRERQIIKLRFDPYQGAKFEIKSIKIIDWPQEAPGQNIDYQKAASWSALRSVSIRKAPEGIEMMLDGADGMAAAPVSNLNAAQKSVITLQLRSRSACHATLLFATDDVFGLQQMSFTLRPDGKSHVYNLDMLNASQWHGNVVALGITPGEKAGDGIALERITISNAPKGPADVRLLHFGVEEALPRAGLPINLAATISNTGGAPVRGLVVNLVLPDGVREISRKAGASAPLLYGEERQWRFKVITSKVGVFTARIDAQSEKGADVAETAVTVTTRPAVVAKGYVPIPRPVKTKLEVGAYYFPGWKSAGQWSPITRFPERRPVLGWYQEGDPEVADWQIKWAVEHGITFFAYDWYWQQGVQSLDHALKDGLFKARYGSLMKFCLLWANHNAVGSSTAADLEAATKFWIQEYFSRKEYLQIDGKPVVIIFTPYRFREDMGSSNVKAAFDAMRVQCAAAKTESGAPLHGLYLIACVNSVTDAKLAELEGYDAITAYNWPTLGLKGNELRAPYAELIEGYKAEWESLTKATSLPMMTPVSGGWDNRPWAGDSALVRSNRTPQLFRQHLQDADAFISSHPKSTLPFVLAEAWNEWGEGSYIEPQQQYGFGYLDAIRDVFASNLVAMNSAQRLLVDVTPEDIGMPVKQVASAALNQVQWQFTKDLQGWETGMQITSQKVENKALTFATTGNDPAVFGPPVQVAANAYSVVHIRVRAVVGVNAPPAPAFGDMGQIFWSTRTTSETESNSVRFPISLDGAWHDYRVRVANNPRWRGQITHVRFDPCERSGITFSVSAIELAPDASK